MGRYLSCAVATSMVVKKKNDKHFEKEELNKLKESVGRIFDLNLYNIEEGDNYLFFDIKKDIFIYKEIAFFWMKIEFMY